jgi:hypothetical protein
MIMHYPERKFGRFLKSRQIKVKPLKELQVTKLPEGNPAVDHTARAQPLHYRYTRSMWIRFRLHLHHLKDKTMLWYLLTNVRIQMDLWNEDKGSNDQCGKKLVPRYC